MKKINKLSIMLLAGAILSLIINLIFYSKLPDQVGMQVNLSGELNNFVPKIIFLLMTPVLIIIDFVYSVMSEKLPAGKALLTGIIIFAANLFILLQNLR